MSLALVWGVHGWALSHARPPSFGRAARARYPLVVCAGGVGLRTRHQPHSARFCELALRAAGAARGRTGGGGRLLPGCGASVVGRSPMAYRPSFGRAAGVRYPLAVGAVYGRGDPSPTPQRAILRAGFARCGGGTEAVWGASPIPAAQPVALFARLAQESSW